MPSTLDIIKNFKKLRWSVGTIKTILVIITMSHQLQWEGNTYPCLDEKLKSQSYACSRHSLAQSQYIDSVNSKPSLWLDKRNGLPRQHLIFLKRLCLSFQFLKDRDPQFQTKPYQHKLRQIGFAAIVITYKDIDFFG